MVACPEGHDSVSDDFCDVCGARIGGSPTGPGRAKGKHRGLGPSGADDVEPCPVCGAPVPGRFCDECGFGLRARRPFAPLTQPAEPSSSGQPGPQSPPWGPMEPPSASWRPAPPARPAPPEDATVPSPVKPAPAPTPAPAAAPPTMPIPLFTPTTWTVLVSADRGYYDRMKGVLGRSGTDVAFPAQVSERRIPLLGKQMRIGRRSAARELEPEIDLAEPPVDPGISRLHAMLIAAPNGTWSVLDPGSANGTQLNGREIGTGNLQRRLRRF